METSKEIQISDKAQRQLLHDWNQTATDYPRDKTVHALFEAQANKVADAVAVDYDGQSLSYGELNERANRLAHYLRAKGVGPDVMVGICIERSQEMVVGLLGILKAGGAYVPLDPDYPKPRLTFMLEDAQVPVLLTLSSLKTNLPEFDGTVVYLDTDWPDIEQASADNPASSASADNLAYVIYTSGSTGQPKGVAVPHRAINRLVSNTDYFQVGPADRVAQASNVSFDAATFELWGALLNGATLVGVNKDVLLNPQSLSSFLNAQGITALFITTALFNLIAREAPTAFNSLRGVMFGGEAVDPKAVSTILTSGPPERLLHVYGPTESTTFASWYKVEEVAEDATTVPIGRPIANTRLYILDSDMNPVPVGVPGELYIGGDGLARGYLGHPKLTAQRFVADPFSNEMGARLYRTGDRVQFRTDGAIEFLGRFDHQVKVRGFRIELGEIETTLRGHPGVQEAVVLAHESEKGDRRLSAYIVFEQGVQLAADELRSFALKILPDYMIPSLFMVLEKLPLAPNGKLDRQALPVPDWSRSTGDSDYEPPRNSVEKQLADVYAEVLGVGNIGVNDNFFELGGHSLSATQLIARVRNIFHVELPFRSVFENPVLSSLADDLQQRISGESSTESFSIEPAQPGEQLPLSYSQERVWFIQHLDDFNRAYNTQATIHWYGELDISVLERCLTEIVRRHQIFRTTFIEENGTPVQCIHEATPVKLSFVNLESSDPAGREDQINRLIQEAFKDPFDVAQLPLIRWTLIKLDETEHIMTHVEQHLIHDGWSLNVFLGELLKLYKAYQTGKPSPLSELPIQFSDFARWQRRWMQGEEAGKQLAYWKQQLAGCQPLLELPYDRPRPAVQRFRGAAPRFQLPAELCEDIDRICREAGVSPFIVFLTGLIILLYRYSSQQDICVGTGMANRRWHEMESLIGMIINNVVLRTDLSDNPSVNTLLDRARDCTLDASANQDMPFEKVVEVLQPERSLSYNPLFQVMLGIHDSPMPQQELPALTGEVDVGLATDGAKFDLTVVVVPGSALHVGSVRQPGPESWTVIWEYNTDLFDEETANQMTSHYQSVLKSMISAPHKQIESLQLLSASEQHQLLQDWNRTATDYPRDKTVAELFEAQVQRTPDAVALEYEGEVLSYAQLNERANRLAHYLQTKGIGPEMMVGVCVERGLEMVVGLLGILKAGGAYVPLDPDYPKSRLAFMLEDTQVPVLLTLSGLKHHLPAFEGTLTCLDTDWPEIEQASAGNPAASATADNLAYVIYTSGSTGRPKGTCIEHRSVVRLVKETHYVELGAEQVFLQFAPISFDASTFEVWGSLLNGARLVICPAGKLSLEELGQVIQHKGVTTLWLTSALFSQMVDHQLPSLRGVRQLLAGGETLSVSHVQKLLGQLGERRLINGYGPTENTTFTCCHMMTAASCIEHNVPIGRPINNTTVYILDRQMNPVPVGVAGELYIGGDGLARGYLKREALTAEKFIANPFSDDPKSRLYRTGDRVRYHRDGTIEFLGRFDHQVKLRGFRIELGEVESVLERQPEVEAAIVLLREDDPGDQRLVAYVVSVQGQAAGIDELRDRLQQTLPAYMVPSMIMQLDALPLTPNGKIDREALPQPDQSALQSKQAFVEPRTELEHQLAQIWSEVLKLERVGVYDNFFDLGGHSLIATQVVSRVRDALGVELPVTVLFEHPTLEELADRIEVSHWSEPEIDEDAMSGWEEFKL